MNSIITIDVEDAINLNLRDKFTINRPPTKRVVGNTSLILKLFEKLNTKATFFVLGEVAEQYPGLIKDILFEGHEIGVHGFHHKLFTKHKPDEIYDQIFRAKCLIEDISGQKVLGHRAPAFSINKTTPWAFDIIRKAGFTYDSSVVTQNSIHYGFDGFDKNISRIKTTHGDLIEVPINTIRVLGKNMPFLGGSALRIMPEFLMRQTLEKGSQLEYLMLYVHPYEVDHDFLSYPDFYIEKIKKSSLKNKLSLKMS